MPGLGLKFNLFSLDHQVTSAWKQRPSSVRVREGRAREGSRRWFPSEPCPAVVLSPLARCSEQVPAQHHDAQVQAPTTVITHCPGCGWAAPLGGHSSGTVWGSRRPGDFTLLVLFKVQRGYQLAALRRYRFFRRIINAQKTFALP